MATQRKCTENILNALELCDRMLELAEEGDTWRQDEGCGVLFGVMRDSAYKLRALAESERRKHEQSGRWEPMTTAAPGAPGGL